MKLLDLFTGIGGFSLAGDLLGIETVAFCEIDKACQKVLKKHWPVTPIYNDITKIKGDEFGKVDIISGGYPCQPFSVGGSQKAQKDNRHLWPEMFRIVTQVRPSWVVCENVLGHVKLGLDQVQHDLENIGYTSRTFDIPALATGANHNRRRIFIVAYTSSNGPDESPSTGRNEKSNGNSEKRADKNSNNEGCGSLRAGVEGRGAPTWRRGVKPPPLRMANELPRRMDRNRMLGNSIDPQIAYEIFKFIIEAEKLITQK